MKRIFRFIKRGLKYLRKNGFKKTVKRAIKWLYEKSNGKQAYDISAKDYVDYVRYLEESYKSLKLKSGTDFVEITTQPYNRDDQDSKVIAWYLPQYYRIDVNDKFHGKGFTEWTNSSQGLPLYTGHYQPHIPYDVGYYNLLDVNTMKRQIELAKMYGVYGFCFHWYWFSGKRTMEKPVELFLQHKELDFPFCLNWATENWTALWDGEDKNIIFEQKLDDSDDEKFMKDILPYFKDSRYIKIDGKPVLSIYNSRIFEKERFNKLIQNFRKIAKINGFPDLYILICNFADFDEDVSKWGADALVEFPPASLRINSMKPQGYLNPNFSGTIFDMNDFINNRKYLRSYKNNNVFRSALTSFDNSSRKAYNNKSCYIFQEATPKTYKQWLKDIMAENRQFHTKDDNIVFVNSWNEWAEGSHLEPDMKYGYAYLQATKEAIEETRVDEHIIERKTEALLKAGKPIVFYIHCIESMGDIVACEPIARFLKGKWPNSRLVWIVKNCYKSLVEFNPFVDEIITVNILSDSMKIIKDKAQNESNVIIDCHYDFRISSVTNEIHRNLNNPIINEQTYWYYGSLLQNFCLAAGLPKLDDSPKFYLDPNKANPFQVDGRYIVIHCTAAENIKAWEKCKWEELVKEIIKKGYYVVEIGLKSVVGIKNKNYIDMTSEHDLQTVAHIIKDAKGFIGIDSGFAHFANALNIPGVLLIGKYKNFDFPRPYTGNYAKGINSCIIYADKDFAKSIPVESVLNAFNTIIDK